MVTMEVMNKLVTTKTPIEGAPKELDFELKAEAINLSIEPGSNDVIVKILYVSVDPYQLNRMKTHSASHTAVAAAARIPPGEVSKVTQYLFPPMFQARTKNKRSPQLA